MLRPRTSRWRLKGRGRARCGVRVEKRALVLAKTMVNAGADIPSAGDLSTSNHVLSEVNNWPEGAAALDKLNAAGFGQAGEFELNLRAHREPPDRLTTAIGVLPQERRRPRRTTSHFERPIMSAYVVYIRDRITDPQEFAEYERQAPAASSGYPMTPLAYYGAVETLEGPPVDGAVIIEFATAAQAREMYESAPYQEAPPQRSRVPRIHHRRHTDLTPPPSRPGFA